MYPFYILLLRHLAGVPTSAKSCLQQYQHCPSTSTAPAFWRRPPSHRFWCHPLPRFHDDSKALGHLREPAECRPGDFFKLPESNQQRCSILQSWDSLKSSAHHPSLHWASGSMCYWHLQGKKLQNCCVLDGFETHEDLLALQSLVDAFHIHIYSCYLSPSNKSMDQWTCAEA